VTGADLSRSYLRSARRRLTTLPVLRAAGGYNDVVREAQQIVELALKAMLRVVGVDPPHLHDVGQVLLASAGLFPERVRTGLPELAEASRELRRNREMSFYGTPDFLPDLEYTDDDAAQAIRSAEQSVALAALAIEEPEKPSS
jgi:HEPN domain-containing protein